MFDISWFELLLVGVLIVIVIGPKELPNTLRTIGKWARRGRQLTSQLRAGFDDMVREAELEDLRKQAGNLQRYNIKDEVGRVVDPTGEMQRDVDGAVREAEREAEADAPVLGRGTAPGKGETERAADADEPGTTGTESAGSEPKGGADAARG